MDTLESVKHTASSRDNSDSSAEVVIRFESNTADKTSNRRMLTPPTGATRVLAATSTLSYFNLTQTMAAHALVDVSQNPTELQGMGMS